MSIKLGILDAVPPEFFVDGEKSDPEKFIDLLDGVGAGISYSIYEITRNEFPDRLEECDAYLITGSPCSVYEPLDWIPTAERFIRNTIAGEVPMVGICFGHQLIAQSLGGAVRRSKDGWLLGLTDISLANPAATVQPDVPQLSLYFINQDQVVDLPPGVGHLAGSQECPNAAFGIDGRLLSIQGHPEQPRSSMRAFIRLLRAQGTLDDAVVEAAHRSMDARAPDADLVARWIIDFLKTATLAR